jgi:hypothetical protein
LDIPSGLLFDVSNFLCAVYAFPSIGKLMRCDSFCLINKKKKTKKHPVSSAITYKRHFAETHTESKFPGSSLETHLSVYIRSTISRKTWMGEKYVVCKLNIPAACI